MNLLRKMFPKHEDNESSLTSVEASPENAIEQANSETVAPDSNVISLPLSQKPDTAYHSLEGQTPTKVLAKGLIGSVLIKSFFDQNHFGLGRHNGTNYRTIDAMEFGRNGRIAEFMNAIRGTVEQTQAKIDRLSSTKIEAEGVCKATSARLTLAITQLERDVKVLNEQSALAAEGKGWVLEALNRYQAGFVKGMREAVEAELILG